MALNLREQFSTDKVIASKFMALPSHDKIQAEYIWIDGSGEFLRSKTRTLTFIPKSPDGNI